MKTEKQEHFILINGQKYVEGKQYRVFSPLDAPYLFLNPTNYERRKRLVAKCKNDNNFVNSYTGKLVQVPNFGKNGTPIGNLLYFEVEDIVYATGHYKQAEQLPLIAAGVVKIKEV